MSRFLLAVALLLAAPLPAAAARNKDALYLAASFLDRLCRGKVAGTFFRTKTGAKRYCQGYISAVAEAYDQRKAKGGWRFCLKSKTTANDAHRAFREFRKGRAKWKRVTAVSVVAHALQDKYPCKSVQPSKPITIVSVEQLYRICYQWTKERQPGYCYGYFTGIIEALHEWNAVAETRFCMGKLFNEQSFRPDKLIDQTTLKPLIEFLAEAYVDLPAAGPGRTAERPSSGAPKLGALHYVVSALSRSYPCDEN